MMYRNQFIACVKVEGKVLRENQDTVRLPFGCEYALFLKNISGRRALVKVDIDGTDVFKGSGLIIDAGSLIDLERFFGDDMNQGRHFRFIERTGDIEQHRGVGAEDGLIRVSFKYEIPPRPIHRMFLSSGDSGGDCGSFGGILRGHSMSGGSYGGNIGTDVFKGSVASTPTRDSQEVKTAAPLNDAGITVEGSHSSQQFRHAYIGELEQEEHVIVLKLLGGTLEHPVEKPVTVKTKKKCNACGRTYPFNYEYCPSDSSYLKVA